MILLWRTAVDNDDDWGKNATMQNQARREYRTFIVILTLAIPLETPLLCCNKNSPACERPRPNTWAEANANATQSEDAQLAISGAGLFTFWRNCLANRFNI
jgi:hypothetical protein